MTYQFWISQNTPSSKNAKQWTGEFLVNNKRVQAWLKATKLEWEFQAERFKDCLVGLPLPYYIEFTFYRGNKHKFDYVNMAQIILDTMASDHYGFKWLQDDNADEVKPYFGDYIYDKKKPGVLIKILKEKPKHY